jgi:hypothetical protein
MNDPEGWEPWMAGVTTASSIASQTGLEEETDPIRYEELERDYETERPVKLIITDQDPVEVLLKEMEDVDVSVAGMDRDLPDPRGDSPSKKGKG